MTFSKKAISLAGILLCCAVQLGAQVRQTREEYISRYMSIAVAHMERYGIPASITMAQGILRIRLRQQPAVDEVQQPLRHQVQAQLDRREGTTDDDAKGECFRSYPSVEASYQDHAEFLDSQPR